MRCDHRRPPRAPSDGLALTLCIALCIAEVACGPDIPVVGDGVTFHGDIGQGARVPTTPPDTAAPPGPDASVTPSAPSAPDTLVLSPPVTVDFGQVSVGASRTRELHLRNVGASPVLITHLAFVGAHPGFEVDVAAGTLTDAVDARRPAGPGRAPVDPLLPASPSPGSPLTLQPGQTLRVPLRFSPMKPGAVDPATGDLSPTEATLAVVSSGLAATRVIGCLGRAWPQPVAKLKVVEGPHVEPETTLHLQGDASVVGVGQVATYAWTVKQPAGSNAVFVPSAAFPNPTLTVAAVGVYEVCLQVGDSLGALSELACETVLVVGGVDVTVTLTWTTPNAPLTPDPGQPAGADLDLHVAQPLPATTTQVDLDCDGAPDPWFLLPHDAYWGNVSPSWGLPDAAPLYGPSLDADTGSPVETFTWTVPDGLSKSKQSFPIAVHYWQDYGYGPALASVDVYVAGVLAYSVSKVKLNPLDLWTVATLNWPNSLSTSGVPTEVLTPCNQTGAPCAPGATGALWQASGVPCVAPCVVPASTGTPQLWKGPSAKGVCGL